ncbi:hypothetical protein TIFTF001_018581 [Ficus carica]|uniref:Fungal lipase-type domain-containing protein n=1 Tax=Ficus carica TaxID=3494 RepID=A0AA88DAX1_FICCA|nr:hypothetical protein TIFTF001_018581 [Ficus carica]
MKLSSFKTVQPCSRVKTTAAPDVIIRKPSTIRCCTLTDHPTPPKLAIDHHDKINGWEHHLRNPADHDYQFNRHSYRSSSSSSSSLSKRWKEYQGIRNWDGLLDPLDENMRQEILRYGKFVDAAYKSFDFDPSSPSYATCKFPKSSLLDGSGLPDTGYRLTRNLRATSGISLPRWVHRAPSWLATQSSWIGYVAVCKDRDEIARLGRRDVVISFRGTATPLEWLENLRATLTDIEPPNDDGSMVESGFLSLYTSGAESLQQMVRAEIARLLKSYGDEPLSLTITGHSLGAALATLAAYDIKTHFKRAPLVTVISFGGPRVGNRNFRCRLEKQGTKVLRIVNSDDVITKVPGFVLDENVGQNGGGGGDGAGDSHVASNKDFQMASLRSRIQKMVKDTRWMYAEVGKELRLSSRDSPYLLGSGFNVATCHELGTYLHLVENFVSSTCPFRAAARKMLDNRTTRQIAGL